MTAEEREIAMEKATKAMTAFTNTYLKNTDTKLCTDKSVPAVVIKGLAEHKVNLGAPLCPCRFYDDKEAEAKDGYWNCPCVPMRERHECHCMLFLTDDNDFAGDETNISVDEGEINDEYPCSRKPIFGSLICLAISSSICQVVKLSSGMEL